MARRFGGFENNLVYHVFNKTIDHRRIFEKENFCDLFLSLQKYYRSMETTMGYVLALQLEPDIAEAYFSKINNPDSFGVQFYAYCLMPTHYHFLIRQTKKNGIQKLIANSVNSFTKIFNKKYERSGPLFMTTFKSVLIKNDEQFKHVSRYIHLNPYSSGIIKEKRMIENYPWSSLKYYTTNEFSDLIDINYLLNFFHHDKKTYLDFVLANADYQRELEACKD